MIPGGSSSSPSRIPTAITSKPSLTSAAVPVSKAHSTNSTHPSIGSSPAGGDTNSQLSAKTTQSQLRSRPSRTTTPHTGDNRKPSSIQRPQSIDIEDEFNDKIRYARLLQQSTAAGEGDGSFNRHQLAKGDLLECNS